MPDTALITGASSGIGREFARLHAARGGDVIITARREAELQALKEEIEAAHGVTVHIIALDLGAEGGANALWDRVTELGIPVDILINNAGFGGQGAFIERDLAQDLAMIDLNVKALVTLTHHAARAMADRGRGKILQVSSTAAYIPGPLQATYYATKAFVSSFSMALDQEMRAKGVTCTALEPGYVQTGFADAADLEGTDLVGAGEKGAQPADVARIGYEAMLAGKLRVINDPMLRLQLRWLIPFAPHRMVLKMIEKMQTKR
ncbi:MAG: SDR family NAD(P)-dependent oxidoreductase [Alterinioella nitratireducens]|uniref:SDR family NAD(P)-dependent oxidoreductase n=1 Tax=Alterinioella nitratireducens TaxID=2735915 RepID=UPI0040599FA8